MGTQVNSLRHFGVNHQVNLSANNALTTVAAEDSKPMGLLCAWQLEGMLESEVLTVHERVIRPVEITIRILMSSETVQAIDTVQSLLRRALKTTNS